MSESNNSADAPPRPLTVPEHLARRFRATAARTAEDPQALIERYLKLIVDVLEDEDAARPHRWFLGYLISDDGPTPPTSFEQIAPDYPRWEARPFRPQGSSIDDEAAAKIEEGESGTALCVLHRDDDVHAIVEILPTRGEIVVIALGADGRPERTLRFDHGEAWLDLGTRVWRRVMHAADALADALVATPPDDGGSGGEPPA